ncbi:hypothetical protein Tco_0409265 [Tanacetum coccineum]
MPTEMEPNMEQTNKVLVMKSGSIGRGHFGPVTLAQTPPALKIRKGLCFKTTRATLISMTFSLCVSDIEKGGTQLQPRLRSLKLKVHIESRAKRRSAINLIRTLVII